MGNRYAVFLVVCATLLSGCLIPTEAGRPPNGEPLLSILELSVDWGYLDALVAEVDSELPSPTHVGFRLVIDRPQGQAVFMEALPRSSQPQSTLQVGLAPGGNAHLQFIVVHEPKVPNEEGHLLYLLGALPAVQLQGGTIQAFTIQDSVLINPADAWELLPPWDGFKEHGSLELTGSKEYHFQWRWRASSGFPSNPSLPQLFGNFGCLTDQGGWYDFNSGFTSSFTAPPKGEWTVGFMIWLAGDRFGLAPQSYYLPTTIRDGLRANTRWTIRFIN